MLQIFHTQLVGLLQNIKKQEEKIEECARLLAQAIVGEGRIYIHGTGSLGSLPANIMNSTDLIPTLDTYSSMEDVSTHDRVLLFSSQSDEEEVKHLIASLDEKNIPYVWVCALKNGEQEMDLLINTGLLSGLVPDEDGTRTGFPDSLVSMYVYHALFLTVKDILADYE
ncbi:DUF2529 family protein [Bacillus alkalicellulosilyticus]|uniref:DUF2529 family protein n=1 Tax=Alkalihalobacterium alkalicellulosilyticum TaxID=1912214 RepID=UPI000998B5E6|nr:DUF2529 family protein [Bacillus alkalicellulosilyticus]